MLLFLAPMIYSCEKLLAGKPTPGSIATIGQIPVLAVTSLITQWQAGLFFVAGIAVSELTRNWIGKASGMQIPKPEV